MQNWISQTNWPKELQDLVAELGVDPLNAQNAVISESDYLKIKSVAYSISNKRSSELLHSALLLMVGDLEGSHTISQSINTQQGSYLHGMMHRRENDFSNAKYWFHRSPTINVFPNAISFLDKDTVTTLCQKANVSSQQLDAFVLTDLHRKVATDAAQVDLMDSVRQISWQEWRVLVSELLRGDAGSL